VKEGREEKQDGRQKCGCLENFICFHSHQPIRRVINIPSTTDERHVTSREPL
jgi:hypothetical protein